MVENISVPEYMVNDWFNKEYPNQGMESFFYQLNQKQLVKQSNKLTMQLKIMPKGLGF